MVVLAFATIYEKIWGSEAVHLRIYGAWWFVALWAVFGVAAVVYLFQQKLYRKPAAFVLHCAFAVILAGAFVTFCTARRGYIHLRQGETKSAYVAEKDLQEQALPFSVKLVLFDISYHPGTDEPADYISFLKVDSAMCQVSMNKIYRQHGYRLYQLEYDPDEMGSTLLVNHDPWGIGVTYTGYLLLAVSMIWLLLLRLGWKSTLGIALGVVAVWVYISQIKPMTPILRTPMLAAHVSLIMVAYALIVFITVTGAIALCSSRRSEKFYRWNSRLLYPAVFLLAAGIFVGAVWANISWGRYWGWDAKETWALITLLIYALPMHKNSLAFFRTPKNFHRYCVFACLTALMTFFGVTFILGGIHAYV